MNFHKFKAAVQGLPVLSGKDIVKLGNSRTMHNQINNWLRHGLISRLRRGLYVLSKRERKIEPGRMFISGQLYEPSYISLEYALGIYGLIPERVFDVTAVTTKNTAQFDNEFGRFSYQHVKREAFRGFKAEQDEAGCWYFLAEPEKAVVDFIYLNLSLFRRGDTAIFSESYRFQNLEILRLKRILAYAKLFNNDKLSDIAGDFCRFARGESL